MAVSFENGTITFDSKNDTFYAGQVVSGIINFTIQTALTCSGMNMLLYLLNL